MLGGNYRTSPTPIWVCVSFPRASRLDANFALRAICTVARGGAIITSPFHGLIGITCLVFWGYCIAVSRLLGRGLFAAGFAGEVAEVA